MYMQEGDGVDAKGAGLLLRGGKDADGAPRVVPLPGRQGGWDVTSENGTAVCSACSSFTAALAPGEVAVWFVVAHAVE